MNLSGRDGRVHPKYWQLGADSGRETSTSPNVMGLNAKYRYIVVPEEGHGIGGADWSQVEVGIAGAIYGDGNLIEMFNTGDVYSRMAKIFYESGEKYICSDAGRSTSSCGCLSS